MAFLRFDQTKYPTSHQTKHERKNIFKGADFANRNDCFHFNKTPLININKVCRYNFETQTYYSLISFSRVKTPLSLNTLGHFYYTLSPDTFDNFYYTYKTLALSTVGRTTEDTNQFYFHKHSSDRFVLKYYHPLTSSKKENLVNNYIKYLKVRQIKPEIKLTDLSTPPSNLHPKNYIIGVQKGRLESTSYCYAELTNLPLTFFVEVFQIDTDYYLQISYVHKVSDLKNVGFTDEKFEGLYATIACDLRGLPTLPSEKPYVEPFVDFNEDVTTIYILVNMSQLSEEGWYSMYALF